MTNFTDIISRYKHWHLLIFLLGIVLIWVFFSFFLEMDKPVFESGNIQALHSVMFYEDKGDKLSIGDIMSGNVEFQSHPRDVFTQGVSDSTFWLRKTLSIPIDPAQQWYLEVASPGLNRVHIWAVAKNTQQVIQTAVSGDHIPFEERAFDFPNPIIELSSKAQGAIDIYLKVQSDSFIQVPLYLHNKEHLIQYIGTQRLVLGVFYGVMLALGLYNLFIFAFIRDLSYLYYVSYILSATLYQAFIDGVGYQYIWSGSIWWTDRSSVLFSSLATIFALLFTRHFIQSRQIVPGLTRVSDVVLGAMLILIPLIEWLEGGKVSSFITMGFILIAAINGFGISIRAYFLGSERAKYYLLAWIPLLVAVVIYILTSADLMELNTLTSNSLRIGVTLEAILLSVALAARINMLRREQLRLQYRHSTELQGLVKERTKELESANRKLKALSEMDGLTQVSNRRYFDQLFEDLGKKRPDSSLPISLLMVDIDFFKKVNDEFGHDAGDHCLIEVAREIEHSLKGAGDVVSRFGGEEFVVTLLKTCREDSLRIAERIRKNVSALNITINNCRVPLSVSIGVADTASVINKHELLKRADLALYQAKGKGRNRVEWHAG